jgi:hypothetical protein
VCCALPASSTVPGGGERELEGKVPHRKGWHGVGAPGHGDGVAPSCRKVVASRRSDASSVAGSSLEPDFGGVDGWQVGARRGRL